MGENTTCFGSSADFTAVGRVCVCVYVCAVWDLPWALHGPEVSQSKHLNTQQLSSKLMTESLQPKVEFRGDGTCTTLFCSHGT